MIMLTADKDDDNITWALCLSTKQHEYRENQYNVMAPAYTIDTVDGSIIPGQSKLGSAKYHKRMRIDDSVRFVASKVFGGIDMPGTYRYISLNKAKIYSDYNGTIRPPFEHMAGIDDSYIHYDGTMRLGLFDIVMTESEVYAETSDLDTYSGGDLAGLMFGDAREECIRSMRENVSSMVGLTVMNGYYTDKQPEIYGSEEADTI